MEKSFWIKKTLSKQAKYWGWGLYTHLAAIQTQLTAILYSVNWQNFKKAFPAFYSTIWYLYRIPNKWREYIFQTELRLAAWPDKQSCSNRLQKFAFSISMNVCCTYFNICRRNVTDVLGEFFIVGYYIDNTIFINHFAIPPYSISSLLLIIVVVVGWPLIIVIWIEFHSLDTVVVCR